MSNVIRVLSPTDAQENCFKRSIKFYIKTAPTCFGAITIIINVSVQSPSSGSALFDLAKVTMLKQSIKIHRSG